MTFSHQRLESPQALEGEDPWTQIKADQTSSLYQLGPRPWVVPHRGQQEGLTRLTVF